MSDVPRLQAPPPGFVLTRDALHQLAFFVLAPRRYDHTDRLGLRATPGGFGTTWYDGPDGRERVRTEGPLLVVEVAVADGEDHGVADRRELRPTSVTEACDFIGMPYREVWFEDFHDPLEPWDPDRTFELDDDAATAVGDWFAFGTAVLEQLRATPGAVDPSPVQLWPEHFDPATELGSQEAGSRASYGASPGDAGHDEPYLYVAPWSGQDDDPFWNDDSFGGAALRLSDLVGLDDPGAAAVQFLRRGNQLLAAADAHGA